MFWDGRLRERADHRVLIEWAAIEPGHRSLGVSRCTHHRDFFFFFISEALRSIQVHSEQNFK